MANWGRALTTLDARNKPFMHMYNGVPAFVYPTTHRGSIVRRVTNATLDDLLRYCDYADPAIRTHQPPTHAIYKDEQVHPYGKEQQDKQAQAIEDARLSEINERNARYGAPTMIRTSSMQAHLNGRGGRWPHEPEPARKPIECKRDTESAKAVPVPAPSLVRRASRQSMNKVDSRRGSRSDSVASDQPQKPKDPQRRSSIAYSLTSISSSSKMPTVTSSSAG